MPKTTFARFAKYAADAGYLKLTKSGTVAIDASRDDAISRHLANALSAVGDEKRARATAIDNQYLTRKAEPVARPRDQSNDHAIDREAVAQMAAAQSAMERGWTKLGGPGSAVGLPIGDRITLSPIGEFGAKGYAATFRGGTLNLSPDGLTVSSEKQTVVSINVVGIECQIRQESSDEMYGVISVIGPANATIISRRFPESGTISMGKDGMRISALHVPIIDRGVLQNYSVWASLVENDSGDVDVIAKKISDKVAVAAAAAIGGLTGVPAEAIADSKSFKENMATGLAWVFGEILGMSDDPYNSESFGLFWGDLNNGPPQIQPTVRRNDDVRTIQDWTHQLILSGLDDGGDRGQYAIYFKVWTEEVIRTVQINT